VLMDDEVASVRLLITLVKQSEVVDAQPWTARRSQDTLKVLREVLEVVTDLDLTGFDGGEHRIRIE